MKIFTEEEIRNEFKLPRHQLPLVIDCIRYVVSRTTKLSGKDGRTISHGSVVEELAEKLHEVWMSADCCPSSVVRIKSKFENVWKEYRRVIKDGSTKRKHRANPKDTEVPLPSRKSSRLSKRNIEESIPVPVLSSTEPVVPQSTKIMKSVVNTRSDDCERKEFREKWENEVGNHIFDIKSDVVIQERVKKGYCFDFKFYEDQKDERKLVICTNKVTKEFLEEEKQRNNRLSRGYLRKLSAYGVQNYEEDSEIIRDDEDAVEFDVEDTTVEYDSFIPFEMSSPVSAPTVSSSIYTRNRSQSLRSPEIKKLFVSVGTQYDSLPKVPTREGRTYDPKYLEAIGIMMSDGLSAPQAIKSTYTLDTVVHNQDRYIPLSMDQEYLSSYSKLKRMEVQEDSMAQTEIIELYSDEDECENNDDSLKKMSEIQKLKSFVEKKRDQAKKNFRNTLPDVHTSRRNHQLMSVFVEGKVAEEMLSSQGSGTFIMPDGTTRNKVGEIAAMLIKVKDKMRAVKAQQIGKGDRKTWADTIVHMLSRLALASGTDVKAIWRSIRSILSDLCEVNKRLGEEIKGVLGSDWEPGQLFCVLHYVLAVPEAIKKVFSRYQSSIGTDKLFPETTGFEMNVEEKIMVVQLLDIWMRLTSIRWHGRAWNKYENFTSYAEINGIRNVGHMIHANRFGEFEERCAGGVYLAEIWVKWLETYQSIRNNLSCYLRSVIGLTDICIFQWCAAAIIGLHLTAPFMSMIIDHKVTQRQLLVVLPKLYEELNEYPNSLIRFDKPAIEALFKYWLPPFQNDTSPYGVDVLKKVEDVADSLDKDLLDKCLRDICKEAAIVLKRQRGNAYGFGDDQDSPDMIQKNLDDDMLDDPEATNTKKIENYLGNLDRIITTAGPQGFDKAADDLVLKYGKDLLLNSNSEWTSTRNRKAAKDLIMMQKKFKENQQILKSNGITDADVAAVTTVSKVQRVVGQLKKSHNGPWLDVEEMTQAVEKRRLNDGKEKALHSMLNLEIRYRKFTMTNVKDICPLFRQRGIDVDEKVKNLTLLMNSQIIGFNANATMDDLGEAIMKGPSGDLIDHDEVEDHAEDPTDVNPSLGADAHEDDNEEGISSSTLWPPKEDEFILALLDDGFYIGLVKKVEDKKVHLNFLAPKKSSDRRYWVWPEREDSDVVEMEYIMEIYPSLTIEMVMSTKRKIVYELLNLEIINIMLQYC